MREVVPESRYHRQDWQLAEKEASEDCRAGKTKSADSAGRMSEETERNQFRGLTH